MGSGSATTQDQRRDRGFTQRSRPERSRRRKRTQHGRKTWGEVVSGRSHEGAPPPCPAPPCSAQREATPRQRPHHCSPRRVALPAPGIRTGHLKMLLLQPLRSVLGLRVPPGNHVLPKTSQCDLLGRGGRRRCNHHMRSLWSRRAFIQRDRCPQMQQRDTEPATGSARSRQKLEGAGRLSPRACGWRQPANTLTSGPWWVVLAQQPQALIQG